ncbi:MAG: diaminopimelate epimerase [Eubacteriaceae bacterium]|jgi:diaminopimelate epimerase
MKYYFDKMHGCGNDFIFIENSAGLIEFTPEQIAFLCDRHFGIGADGLILTEKRAGRFFMNYYNSDGTAAQMCGNGMRCTAEYLRRYGFIRDPEAVIGSRAGDIPVQILEPGFISVQLKVPDYSCASLPMTAPDGSDEAVDCELEIDGQKLRYGCLSVGNPHMVVIADPEKTDIDKLGPALENHPMFPEKANINFAWADDPGHIRLITWERGAGRTLACGTGTSATAALLNKIGLTDNRVEATVPGGKLDIEITEQGIIMTGPAAFVFSGEIDLPDDPAQQS